VDVLSVLQETFMTRVLASVFLLLIGLLVGCASFPPKEFSTKVGHRFYRDVTLLEVHDDGVVVQRSESPHSAPILIPSGSKPHAIGEAELLRILGLNRTEGTADLQISSLRQLGPLTFPPD
jgi:hypothetical protein